MGTAVVIGLGIFVTAAAKGMYVTSAVRRGVSSMWRCETRHEVTECFLRSLVSGVANARVGICDEDKVTV